MLKHVALISYSQTGQTNRCGEALVKPLEDSGVKISRVLVEPKPAFPFPWSIGEFFGVLSSSVLSKPTPIEETELHTLEDVDLVILSTQVWFLSPSLPVQSLLLKEASFLKGKKLLTVISCRNMWQSAYRQLKVMIANTGAIHVGNIAVTDDSPMVSSFIMTPRWLLTGKKGPLFGVFPRPGITEGKIVDLSRFAKPIQEQYTYLGETRNSFKFEGLKASVVEEKLIIPEIIAKKVFVFWAKIIARVKGINWLENLMITLFVISLLTLIIVVLPITLIIRLTLKPAIKPQLEKEAEILKTPGVL